MYNNFENGDDFDYIQECPLVLPVTGGFFDPSSGKVYATEQMPPTVTAVETASPKIVGEVLEKRKKNVKHFLNEDLSYTAAVYPTSVHCLENGNNWWTSTTVRVIEDK